MKQQAYALAGVLLCGALALPTVTFAQRRSNYDDTQQESWKVVKEREKAQTKTEKERIKDQRAEDREAWKNDRRTSNDRFNDEHEWEPTDRRRTGDDVQSRRVVEGVPQHVIQRLDRNAQRLDGLVRTLESGGAENEAEDVEDIAQSLRQIVERNGNARDNDRFERNDDIDFDDQFDFDNYERRDSASVRYELPSNIASRLERSSERLQEIADNLADSGATRTPPQLNEVARDLENIVAQSETATDRDEAFDDNREISYEALVQVKRAATRLDEIAGALEGRDDLREARAANQVVEDLTELINDHKADAVKTGESANYSLPSTLRERIRDNAQELRGLAADFESEGDDRAAKAIDEVVASLDKVAGQSTTASRTEPRKERKNLLDTLFGWI